MAHLFFDASNGGDTAEGTARGGANEAGLAAEPQRRGFDEPAVSPKLGLRYAGGKRAVGFASCQQPDGDRDASLAEIALWVEVAGRRAADPGWPGRSTALPISVAAASAIAAEDARTVTASATPSEKLRPRQPDVATPRARSRARTVAQPNRLGRSGRSTMPIESVSRGARCSAMSPPLLT